MTTLKNKVALITGGTKGIGYGIAERLLQEGVNVAVTSRTLESAQEAADRLNKNSKTEAKAIGFQADVRNLKSQQDAVNAVEDVFGQLDVMVANAGIGHLQI